MNLAQEIVKLREQVFGRDNAYTDELADELGLETEPKHNDETDEQYKARQQRVADRKERLGRVITREDKSDAGKTAEKR